MTLDLEQLGSEQEAIIELLQIIAQNTSDGLGAGVQPQQTVNIEREFSGGSPTPVGALDPRRYSIKETADLDDATEGGAIKLEPGDRETIVEAESSNGVILMAVGAADKQDVRYRLYMDGQRTVGNETNSPLGTIHSPFSFYQMFGALLPANRRIEYQAQLDSDAPGPVELVGVLHVLTT